MHFFKFSYISKCQHESTHTNTHTRDVTEFQFPTFFPSNFQKKLRLPVFGRFKKLYNYAYKSRTDILFLKRRLTALFWHAFDMYLFGVFWRRKSCFRGIQNKVKIHVFKKFIGNFNSKSFLLFFIINNLRDI